MFSSYLFSGLYVGAAQMQRVTQLPIALSQVIQGLVVLCILGTEILLDYDFLPLKRWLNRRRLAADGGQAKQIPMIDKEN